MESMEIKNSTILVTGGAGFIGSNLVKELVRLGASVIVVDIKINSKSIFALEELDKKVKFEIADIRSKEKVFSIFKKYKPSLIVHLAAEPIVQEAYVDPRKAFETNIMGTVNVLEAARTSEFIKGIIVASSDKAYGKTKKAYTEDSPLRGDYPYDVSKSSMDLISQSYFKTYGLPIVITRFGNVYGEGDFHFGRIIPDICEAIIKKKVLRIRSDGTYVRDYLYIKEVVNGYIFLLKKLDKIKGEAFNFSSRDTLSVLDVVKKAEKILKVKIPYKILNTAKNEIPYQHLNDEKIRRLGWSSGYDLNNSLPLTFNWYKNLL